MGLGLYSGFMSGIFPLILEGGKLMLTLGFISGCFILMRGFPADSIKKIKYATIGYALLQLCQMYIQFVDKIISQIHF